MNAGGCSPQKNQKKNQKKTKPIYQFWCSDWFFWVFLVFFFGIFWFFWFFWFFWDDIPTLKSNAKKPKKPKKTNANLEILKNQKKPKKQKKPMPICRFWCSDWFFLVFLGEHPPNAFDVSILQENVINCLNFPKIFRGSAPRLH